ASRRDPRRGRRRPARGRLRRRRDRRDHGARGAEPVHQLRERGVPGAGRLPRRETAGAVMDTTSTLAGAMAPAPEFEVAAWLNTPGPVTLASLRGRVVAVYAFQMLCPGCVTYALPQAKAMEALFGR